MNLYFLTKQGMTAKTGQSRSPLLALTLVQVGARVGALVGALAWLGLLGCGRPSSSPEAPPALPPQWQEVISSPSVTSVTGYAEALAKIGADHSHRASGSQGYQQSVSYVLSALPKGFTTEQQSFSYKAIKVKTLAVEGQRLTGAGPSDATAASPSLALGQPRTITPAHMGATSSMSTGISGKLVPATHQHGPYPDSSLLGRPAQKILHQAAGGYSGHRLGPMGFARQPRLLRPATGCLSSDFAMVQSKSAEGRVAAIADEGHCSLTVKARHAAANGAAALLVLSSRPHSCMGHSITGQSFTGQSLAGQGSFRHRDGDDSPKSARLSPTIPVYRVDRRWWQQQISGLGPLPATPAVELSFFAEVVSTENIIARYTPSGQPLAGTRPLNPTGKGSEGKTFILGAHLDSVAAGPGINDNVSGVAVLLSLAQAIAQQQPQMNQELTLIFWGAEEDGLKGSRHFVQNLTADQVSKISGYLNLDMVGSPNYGRFIYGNGGSNPVRETLASYYQQEGLATEAIVVGERSDHFPFQQVGVSVAGLYTGGSEIKSSSQAGVFGGSSGKSFDSCYHAACDTLSNINSAVLLESYRAAAHTAAMMIGGGSGAKTSR